MKTNNRQVQHLKRIFLSILLFFILLTVNQKIFSQNQVLDSVNLQLRQLFVGLDRPSTPKEFLYDMAAHLTDSVFFQVNCPDTNNTHIFQRVYEEVYHSAYDTTTLIYPDTLFARGTGFTNDTIPVGIITYSHYLLKPEALSTDTYFYFDTVNTILTDKYPRPNYPYDEGGIFMGAPLVPSTHFTNPVFRIDPQFILFDQFNDPTANGWQLYIDFGDGNGWVYFDHTIITYHSVTYAEVGNMTMKFKWQVDGNDKTSLSRIFNPNLTVILPGDETHIFPGIHAVLYKSCNSAAGFKGRTVIYLSGYDVLDFINSEKETPETIYSKRILTDQLAQLRNNGYDFLVVDWHNSRTDIRFNALYLVNLLQHMKAVVIEQGDREQFVIMGESMGGLIGRYALTYMESDEYQSQNTDRFFVDESDDNNASYLSAHPDIYNLPTNWSRPEEMHNTRLLITLDAPHQGANVPLSLQKAYKNAFNILGPHIGMGLLTTATMYNLFLESHAAQQMLLYHVDTESGSGLYKTYSRHPAGVSFYSDLQREGAGYPQHCKVVLMSNGSLNGERQTNYYTEVPKNIQDNLLDFKAELYLRMLWLKIPIFGGELTLSTNPSGNGQILKANAGSYSVRIKLRWFGIRVITGYNSIFAEENFANTLPYCTASGGFIGNPIPENTIGPNAHSNDVPKCGVIFNFLGYNLTNNGQGCISFDSHLGPNGFSSTNFDYYICSSGFDFNFVPTQSALDYGSIGNSPDLGFDIQHDNTITEKLASIPAGVDVIIGYPVNQDTEIGHNMYHVGFRNDPIRNLTGLNPLDPFSGLPFTSGFENTYFSCLSDNNTYDRVRRGFLNLEIGDEELYLENNNLDWTATYVTEYDLHVNDRNPHYWYPNFVSTDPNVFLDGIYSKEDDFIIDNNGFATFTYDNANTPTGLGFNFTNPNGSYFEDPQPMDVCCVNYSTAARNARKPVSQIPVKKKFESYLKVYPNPNAGTQAVLKYKFKQTGKVNLEIYSLSGQRILLKQLQIPDASKEITTVIDLSSMRLHPGMYLIRLHNNNNEILNTKIIITN